METSTFSKNSRLARALAVVSSAVAPTLTPSTMIGPLKPTDFSFANTALKSMTRSRPGGGGRLSYAPEAVDVVAETHIGVAGAFVVAIAGTAVLGAESPRTTAQHFVPSFIRPFGILAGSLLVIVHFIEIVAPFPHVASHVEESPRIRLLLTDGPGMSARILVEPRVVAQFCRVVSEKIRRPGSRSARVFPFGLGGQPVSVGVEIALQGFQVVTGLKSFQLGALVAKSHRIRPTQLLDGILVSLPS